MTDTTKLKIAPGSYFFKLIENILCFRREDTGWIRFDYIHLEYDFDYLKRLISTCAVKEWKDEYDKIAERILLEDKLTDEYLEAGKQIKLWSEFGNLNQEGEKK
jgi:hypothetical protein